MAKKMNFVESLTHALYNCWESAPNYNKNTQVNLQPLKDKTFLLHISNVYGNGTNYTADSVPLNATIHMVPNKDHKITLTMPRLYASLNKFYQSYHLSDTFDPIAYATSLPAFVSDRVMDVDKGVHDLPGNHHPVKFATDCNKFTMTVNGAMASIKPLSGKKSFNFAVVCASNRGYVINSICEIINFEAYLYHEIKNYYDTQRHFSDFSKAVNG